MSGLPSPRRASPPWVALALLGGLPGGALGVSGDELADFDAQRRVRLLCGRRACARGPDRRPIEALSTATQPGRAYQYAHAQFRRARLLRDAGDEAAARRRPPALPAALDAPGAATPGSGGGPACSGRRARSIAVASAAARRQGRSAELAKAAPRNPRRVARRAFAAEAAGAARAPRSPRMRQLAAGRGVPRRHSPEPTATEPGVPSWGARRRGCWSAVAAEALGDWLGAREAYERCLVLAPDYALAARAPRGVGRSRAMTARARRAAVSLRHAVRARGSCRCSTRRGTRRPSTDVDGAHSRAFAPA